MSTTGFEDYGEVEAAEDLFIDRKKKDKMKQEKMSGHKRSVTAMVANYKKNDYFLKYQSKIAEKVGTTDQSKIALRMGTAGVAFRFQEKIEAVQGIRSAPVRAVVSACGCCLQPGHTWKSCPDPKKKLHFMGLDPDGREKQWDILCEKYPAMCIKGMGAAYTCPGCLRSYKPASNSKPTSTFPSMAS